MPGSDNPREACGVFGVYGPGEDVARLTFYGLYALQHRGQESAGIAASDGNEFSIRTGMGLVSQVFDEEDLAFLRGHIAIGHTRYSTAGGSLACNAQPVIVRDHETGAPIALAHNGNLTNADILREDLLAQGVNVESTADSELIAHLLTLAPAGTWEERFHYVMRRIEGAYSLTIMTKDSLFAVRDPMGVRPLCLGRVDGGWVVASESCALEHLGIELERDVEPGEVVQIDASGMRSFFPVQPARKLAGCTFEYIYFARPDSRLAGKLVYPTREEMGAQLAREYPVEADIVIGVPLSAIPAAIGYAAEAGIPFREGLVQNRYVGRTFIQPDQRIREAGVSLKFNALKDVLHGKRVVVVDDSIVRGTTTPRLISLIRRAGATEIHMRITAPPMISPCFFGVDLATKWELIAANKSVEEIRQHIGADSLGYLSLEGLMKAIGEPEERHCNACFTGVYPIDVQMQMNRLEVSRRPVGVADSLNYAGGP
ncbi:MAG: amidophosphoribosyltransferase [Dehalococcoidia bacterium]|nr:MAG: amidophosphoribosyltransferase [bacterium]MCE7928500.1 amidophosphoribosyltransferase [Chloroflexi bacterium CFX7]MCK6564479.1 amidophosphoribosyltransferase [Dehalococcoidia bacterium]MCL4232278.1 amidophosphoribosyltransferase [Dehalococcoidia bacterium]NUQ54739.1 amidophosphoribosyltransferase [Dehalococcoidia bacterium]